MKNLSFKIGYWSSISLIITFIIWIICFTAIAASSPLFYWSTLSDYVTYVHSNNQVFQNLAKIFMLLVGPAYVIFISSFYDFVPDNKKVLIRISLLFGIAFAVLSSLHYFVQLSFVRLSIEKGDLEGLEHFIQANPISIMNSIDMAGWTLFLGLSSAFIFPVFKGDRLNRIIRYSFIFNGFSCLFAGLGFLLQIDVLTFLFVNIGIGGALMTISVASAKLFGKLIRKED